MNETLDSAVLDKNNNFLPEYVTALIAFLFGGIVANDILKESTPSDVIESLPKWMN